MNLVVWNVSIPAVRVLVVSALSIVALPLLMEMTLFFGALFMYFFKMF